MPYANIMLLSKVQQILIKMLFVIVLFWIKKFRMPKFFRKFNNHRTSIESMIFNSPGEAVCTIKLKVSQLIKVLVIILRISVHLLEKIWDFSINFTSYTTKILKYWDTQNN